jgi:uncharacterized caspase-like protein
MFKKIALLIGVSEYGEGMTSLSAPLNDVEAMQQVLQDPKLGGFDQVEPLRNPDLIEMRKAIVKLFEKASNNDLVLLYFSGHGYFNQDNEHLYLANRITAQDELRATAVEASFIQEELKLHSKRGGKRQVLILDACYSGGYTNRWQAKTVSAAVDIKQQLEQQLGAKGSVVLTSSSKSQLSFEKKDSMLSLYTEHLVKGIQSGAADKDNKGHILIRELHEYVTEKVKEENRNMNPNIIVDGEGYNIIIAKALRKYYAEVLINSPSELDELINDYFNSEKLEIFLSLFDIPYEELNGKTLSEKVKTLISIFPGENDTKKLIQAIKEFTPEAFI